MSFDFIIVGIDPGIDVAGYSVIKHSYQNCISSSQLLSVSAIKADLGTTDARVRFLNSKFSDLIYDIKDRNQTHKIIAAIECPNEVLYGGAAGRVSGVIKLIAAAYGIFGGIISVCPTFIVRPRDWQPNKAKREIKDVKAWSRAIANTRLKVFSFDIKPFIKEQQDIADALNIGVCGLSKILNKDWIV